MNPRVIIQKDSIEDYHNAPYYGSSTLKKWNKKTPLHAITPEDNKESSDLVFGNAYHCLILEPDLFVKKYYVVDFDERPKKEMTMAANDNKNWLQELKDKNAGKIMLEMEDNIRLCNMRKALHEKYRKALFLLKKGEQEISHYLEYNGLKVKTRPDNKNALFLSDLKTCNDASPQGFSAQCGTYGYHLSAALYIDVDAYVYDHEPLIFNWVAQEKTPPYAVATYYTTPDSPMMEKGRNDYLDAMDKIKRYKEENNAPGYELFGDENGMIELDLPKWAYYK